MDVSFRQLHQRLGRRLEVHPLPELQVDPALEGLDRRQLSNGHDHQRVAVQPHLRGHLQQPQVRRQGQENQGKRPLWHHEY